MDEIEELITYHQESEYIDFKVEEYKESNKPNLIKDVLAMANAETINVSAILHGGNISTPQKYNLLINFI